MRSYIGFVSGKTNGWVRSPTMTRLFDTEFLFSSHVAPNPMERLAVCTTVTELSKKGRETP